MTKTILAIALAMTGSAALAQDGAFSRQDGAADAVTDLQDSIRDTNDRTRLQSGNTGRPLGWSGSLSALASATSGNTDTFDLGIGTRLGYFDGTNGHRFNLSLTYGEEDGKTNENDTLFSYDYTREFSNNLYGYGQLQLSYSEFGAYEEDHFVGVGLGYHVIASGPTQWSVQTGPGYREAKLATGQDITEGAWSLSSQFSHAFTDTVSMYNDTDILYSDADTFTTNELGLAVGLSRSLALRTSLTTEHHSNPLPGFKDTDNKLGMSIVYNFN